MSIFTNSLSRTEWEDFCEAMLRHYFGVTNFYYIPDKDEGDYGIEFFTSCGTIFQCYKPDDTDEMKIYKRKIQSKINADLKKLKENESDLIQVFDQIKIREWVLLTPENKSKDLLIYCQKKKKEVLSENLPFIDADKFQVRIHVAEDYQDALSYAQQIFILKKAVNIPKLEVSDEQKEAWLIGNTERSDNIERKSNNLMGSDNDRFKDQVLTKYLQIESFLDKLRLEYPDLHGLLEGSGGAQLERMSTDSNFLDLDKGFLKSICDSNREAFSKFEEHMSDENVEALSMGYLSKWMAECDMDFENE